MNVEPEDHAAVQIDLPQGLKIRNLSTHAADFGLSEEHQNLFSPIVGQQRQQKIRRKPLPIGAFNNSPQSTEPLTPLLSTPVTASLLAKPKSPLPQLYWPALLPALTSLLLGCIFALVHHAYLGSLHDRPVTNQAWTSRYSLGIAFVTRACLSTAIGVAFTQILWNVMGRSKRGLSLGSIDSLFGVSESPRLFLSWELWTLALPLMPIALAMWLMPLVSLVTPSALTVGSLQNSTTKMNCFVPSINWTGDAGLPLSDYDYEGFYVGPSASIEQLVQLTSQSGAQQGWSSPCGLNCTYNVTFDAPAWSCHRSQRVEDLDAPWNHPGGESIWFPGYGDGSNYTVREMEDTLEFLVLYEGAYNNKTSDFWVGATDSVSPMSAPPSLSVKDFLNLHLYQCHFANARYHLRVSYADDKQINEILDLHLFEKLEMTNDSPGFEESSNPFIDDVKSLYNPFMSLIEGSITRDPRSIIVSGTELASIPKLCRKYNGSMGIEPEDPFIPVLDLGPVLEEVSHNISISLMSNQKLSNIVLVNTPCRVYHDETVWKYKKWLLFLPYASALAATVLSFIAAADAIRTAGVVRDKSFSTILRSTRTHELDNLDGNADSCIASLPLPKESRKRKLVFAEQNSTPTESTKRMSFRLVENVGQLKDQPMSPALSSDEKANWLKRLRRSVPSADSSLLSPFIQSSQR